ncbi:GTP cyclohydrolase [Chitinophaga pendula]|uniref:YciI family protein n=1 Tax=Chitinophaga TaxID=79328 RepID=UPI000BAF648A|nr:MULTISPECIES: YciI family protein [Chitinophaga]ASZ10431.1 GTP cyclohydrolase [Chitinophaga sp. MD30]UCJ06600.1 GTP cyclohydrolase [Chitinophaga pendula]
MYLILLQYIRPIAAIEHYMDAHKAFLEKYYKSGQFILSGRKKLKTGGLILCKASSRREVEQIIADDPLDKFQLALYEIIEFEPNSYINALEPYIS